MQGADEFLAAVAGARGKLRKGGVPDIRAAARIVLQVRCFAHSRCCMLSTHSLSCTQDWNEGRIPYYTLPPSRGNTEFQEAAIVSNWANEFDADAVFAQVSFWLALCESTFLYRRREVARSDLFTTALTWALCAPGAFCCH